MKNFLLLIILFFSVSCATRPTITMEPNKDFWLGKTSDDLAMHPLYATLELDSRKTESGIETKTFKNKGGIQSNTGCYGSGCNGFSSEIVCSHVFFLRNGIITNFHRVGACGPEMLEFRPLDSNGNPLLSARELEELHRSPPNAQVEKRDCSALGKIIKSQGCN